MSSNILVKDKGAAKRILQLQALRDLSVTVGVHSDEGAKAEGDLTVADIATIHEYGAEGNGVKIPERSWLRGYATANENRHKAMVRVIGEQVASKGTEPRTLFEQLGAKLVGEIKERILARIAPANADSTKRRKGSDVPLVDTGQFIGSIAHKVE